MGNTYLEYIGPNLHVEAGLCVCAPTVGSVVIIDARWFVVDRIDVDVTTVEGRQVDNRTLSRQVIKVFLRNPYA